MIEKNKKAVSKRKVKYEATIEGLNNDLDSYIRAYAINAVDTAYGEILPFKTKDGLGSVKTLFPVNGMSTSVQCGGMIKMCIRDRLIKGLIFNSLSTR